MDEDPRQRDDMFTRVVNLAFAELLSGVGGMDLYDRRRVLEAYRLSNMAE